MAVEHFLAIEADLHRPIEQQRRLGDDELVIEGVALAAEAAAVGRGDHADVGRGHRERLRQRAVQVVRGLGAGVDDQLAVRIFQRHRRVLLDRQVRIPLEEEHIVEQMIGGGEGGVDVAELERHRLVDVAVIAVVVNARLVVREAVGRPREGAQRLVCDVDQVDREIGGGFVARDDGRHRIADEADLVAAQRMFVVAHRENAVGDRKRFPGQHQVNTVDLRGLARVHADDPRVGLRRAQQPAVQHSRQDDVVGEARLPRDLGAAIDPPARTTNHACGFHWSDRLP